MKKTFKKILNALGFIGDSEIEKSSLSHYQRPLTGISGYVGVMCDNDYYNNLSKIDKLKYDLQLLNMAGYDGPCSFNTTLIGGTLQVVWNKELSDKIKARQVLKDDVKRQILAEERKEKIKSINTL